MRIMTKGTLPGIRRAMEVFNFNHLRVVTGETELLLIRFQQQAGVVGTVRAVAGRTVLFCRRMQMLTFELIVTHRADVVDLLDSGELVVAFQLVTVLAIVLDRGMEMSRSEQFGMTAL